MSTIINDAGGGISSVKNTGANGQKVEGAVKTYILAKDSFSFADKSAMLNSANWNSAILAKNIVPFFEIEVLEANNKDATIANKRFKDSKTKTGVKGATYTHELSSESHEAVYSYDNALAKGYTRIFRVTVENEVLCEVQDDGTIKGEPMSSFIVEDVRPDATDETDPTTKVMISFKPYVLSNVIPDFDARELNGIFDVCLKQVSATATSIKFSAKSFEENVENLTSANISLKDANDADYSFTFIPFDTVNKVYEITGTGFANDFKLDINGVQEIGTVMYESTDAITVKDI